MYDDNGLTCCGFHISGSALSADNLKLTAEFNQALGNRFLIVAAEAARMKSATGISEFARFLNDLVDKLAPYGMFPGYHAHNFDFATVDGEIAWNRLFGATRKEVIMQLDTGNCASGGGDPIAALRRFPGRAKSVHLKDNGGPEGSVIGEGELDWPTIFQLCDTQQPVEWYVVEEGSNDGLGFDIPRRSLEALRKMGR
jgi:sugar phosphate isomerase/epimerase